jgi:hypothetical protein
MAVITEMTEKTPIVMPIIVSAARSLFAPNDASAILMISLKSISSTPAFRPVNLHRLPSQPFYRLTCSLDSEYERRSAEKPLKRLVSFAGDRTGLKGRC